jgi:hypothetical protein
MHFGQNYPLDRAGQPAELASIYVELAANDASYSTGDFYGASGDVGQPLRLAPRADQDSVAGCLKRGLRIPASPYIPSPSRLPGCKAAP